MDERQVVTCFLLKRTPDGDRILIVRRSGQVSTYRGRWAAISGGVDTTPDQQALTEIAEETGLALTQTRLLARGAPLVVLDPDLDRRWIVHPYLFLVLAPESIRLDWEQSEACWVAPGEIAALDAVPRLGDALARVYPPPTAMGTVGE
jgi:8-oxo-dGTP pyrophosphatase MutT (NUDIX family)